MTTRWNIYWRLMDALHYFKQGYWLKFEFKRLRPTPQRLHGLQYGCTLHDPEGKRLVGFDNAHRVPARGSLFRKPGKTYDHWHRSSNDEGRPYRFTTADQLLAFFRRSKASADITRHQRDSD